MFARHVTMHLKPNGVNEFNRIVEKEILPVLRNVRGFRDEIVLTTGGSEVIAISLWDQREDAEAYNRDSYPKIQTLLANILNGTPVVKTGEVSYSSLHKTAARATA
jgi:heme-degrading monooxygenase HmoA